MVPIGTDTVSKEKLQRLRAKEKEVEKIFNDTHPQYPRPQKRWRPKVVEINQTATKTENETTTSQLSTGTTDNLAIKDGSSVDDTDRPTLESGPSALHQDTSNDMMTPTEKTESTTKLLQSTQVWM
jgi:hypothetical protein